MTRLLTPVMYLALAGFIVSVAVHIAAWIGIDDVFGFEPWFLHVGIFVVWVPAVVVSQRLTRDFLQRDFWNAALRRIVLRGW